MLQKGNKSLKRTKALHSTSGELKRSGRLQGKPITKVQVEQDKLDRDRMIGLFNDHWNTRPRVCEQCDRQLWGENLSIYHHHILEKGNPRYEHLKYNLNNLMMLCGNCHTQVTNGFPGDKVIEQTKQTKVRFNVV